MTDEYGASRERGPAALKTAERVYIDDCVSAEATDEGGVTVTRMGWVLKTHEQAQASDHADDLMTGDSDADANALTELMSDPLRAPVESGFARVRWVHCSEPEVVETTSLTVLDRPHLLGDMVAKADDPGGESGVICEVRSSANVRFVLTGQELQRHQSLQLGSKVCDGDVSVHRETNWAGFVRGAVFSVVIALGEATYVFPSLSSSEPPRFMAVNDDEDPGLCPHFPGQEVEVTREVLLKASCIAAPPEWADGVPPEGEETFLFVVNSVQLEEVVVDWACAGPGGSEHPPAMIMPANQLEWLRLSDKGYRIGDYVKVFDVDGLSPASHEAERTARIVSTVTECRVLWATSGVVEDRWISSVELVPRPPTLTKDFGPLSYVVPTEDFIADAIDQAQKEHGGRLPKGEAKAIRERWENRLGLVHAIDEGAQQCSVHWVSQDSLDALPSDDPGQDGLYLRPGVEDGLKTEVMETYDVEAFEFGYLPGDIVRMYQDDYDYDTASASTEDPITVAPSGKINVGGGFSVDVEIVMSSAIGAAITTAVGAAAEANVSGPGDAMQVESASTTRDWIGQIVGISRNGLLRVRWHSGNISMESPFNIELVDDKGMEEPGEEGEFEEEMDEDGIIVEPGDDDWTDVDEDDGDEAHDMSEDDEPPKAEAAPKGDAMEAAAGKEDGEISDSYPAFEVLETSPADHAFRDEPSTTISPKVVGKEVRTLLKGLPQDGSIVIRGYEDRADLCRAVVFGPPGTPYAGVPFFFDIFLPSDYPKSPPKMLYWAGASRDRLNPNLYENGKVCLSLLGTWNGPGWDPKSSSILQLLLSVQALVLVEEPYFNEPGFEKLKGTAEGTRASKLYSENACVLSMQSFVSLWSHTPEGFKPILQSFYKGKGEGLKLLERCRSLVKDPEVSAGFARLLQKRIIPKLEAIFESKV